MEIQTERLILRTLQAQDENVFTGFFSDPDFMQYSRAVDEINARATFLQRLSRATEYFSKLSLVEKATGNTIGYCGVESCELDGRRELELGYRLTKSAHGHGYATEAARAILDYYHKQGVTDIIAYTAPGNIASQSVLKKLGYKAVKNGEIDLYPIVIFRR